jgi:hypothetical protein
MTHHVDWLENYKTLQKKTITVANQEVMYAIGEGDLTLKSRVNGKEILTRFRDVLYVPKLNKNLISVGRCTGKGTRVVFEQEKVLLEKRGKLIITGKRLQNDLYLLNLKKNDEECHLVQCNLAATFDTWHERLGHPNEAFLKDMVTKNSVTGLKIKGDNKLKFCETCL